MMEPCIPVYPNLYTCSSPVLYLLTLPLKDFLCRLSGESDMVASGCLDSRDPLRRTHAFHRQLIACQGTRSGCVMQEDGSLSEAYSFLTLLGSRFTTMFGTRSPLLFETLPFGWVC